MIALPTIPSWNVMYFIRIKIYYRAIHAKMFICLFSNSVFRSFYLDWKDHMFLFWPHCLKSVFMWMWISFVLVMIALPNNSLSWHRPITCILNANWNWICFGNDCIAKHHFKWHYHLLIFSFLDTTVCKYSCFWFYM